MGGRWPRAAEVALRERVGEQARVVAEARDHGRRAGALDLQQPGRAAGAVPGEVDARRAETLSKNGVCAGILPSLTVATPELGKVLQRRLEPGGDDHVVRLDRRAGPAASCPARRRESRRRLRSIRSIAASST